jgi:hypothetical protein
MKTLVKKIMRRPAAGRLPVVGFESLCPPRDFALNMLEPRVTDGNVSVYELFVINTLVQKFAPMNLFEFGTFNGRTALNLAANSPTHARIHTLDLPGTELQGAKFALDQIERKYVEKPASGEKFGSRPEAQKITQLLGDSAKFDYTPYVSQMDFVFVDASHAYEYVLNDSRVALQMLRNGRGIILWHDYGRPQWWPGVIKALDELHQTNPSFTGLVHIEGTSLVCLVKD